MKKVILLFIVSILLVGCGDNEASGNKANERNYNEELMSVATQILDNSTIAEDICNIYADLWGTNIKRAITVQDIEHTFGIDKGDIFIHFDAEGEEEVSGSGDFNTLINKVSNYYAESGKIEELETNSDEIESKIKELNDPPEDYEKIYDEIVELYTTAEEYIQMAISPSGSLVSFNEERNQLSKNILGKYKGIEVKIPSNEKNE